MSNEYDLLIALDVEGLGEYGPDSAGQLQHPVLRVYASRDEVLGFIDSDWKQIHERRRRRNIHDDRGY